MAKFTGDDLSFDELLGITCDAYATFSAEDVTHFASMTRLFM